MGLQRLNQLPSIINFLLLTVALSLMAAQAALDIANIDDIKQQLPSELANTNLTLDDAKNLLKEKCVQVAGEKEGGEAFAAIEAATAKLGECLTSIVNFTGIQSEIEEASPRGELDVVFNKYCKKRPEALECVKIFNEKLVPCLEKEEQENNDVFMRIISSLLNFVCHKGGDQIALFIAEKGPECLESKKDNITNCLNTTFSDYVPKDGINDVKSLPKFILGPKECGDMEALEQCIVASLEKCTEITPANIVESMFRFIKNETICRTTAATKSAHSAAAFYPTLSSISLGIGMLFYIAGKKLFT